MQILQRQFEGHQMRVIERDGHPWFVLADVCAALDLSSPHKVAARLDEDEKGRTQIPTLGGEQEVTVINESGLYAVILRSDKPQAKPFRKWVTNEVLPSLRRTGTYTSGQPTNTPALISARGVSAAVGIPPRHASTTLRRHGIEATHHFLEARCGAPAYLYSLADVQAVWPDTVFTPYQGEARPGVAPVARVVGAAARTKAANFHQPRLLPTDTSTEQLARRLLSLEAQKKAVLRELAALA